METEIWASMYVVPVIGVFILAGAVYFLSFRTKDDGSDQLKNYLNVLSDDEKNRRTKRLRKFGNTRKLPSGNGGDSESKQVDSDSENINAVASSAERNATTDTSFSPNKLTQVVNKKVDPVENARSALLDSLAVKEHDYSSGIVSLSSSTPETVTDAEGTEATATNGTEMIPDGAAGWHKAVSRKDKKLYNTQESKCDDATNHSTTSDESRPSFKNSCSSRNSSPYRHRMTSHNRSNERTALQHRKPASRKSTMVAAAAVKPAHVLQRPEHLKLDSNSRLPANSNNQQHLVISNSHNRPTILLKANNDHYHVPYGCFTSKSASSVAVAAAGKIVSPERNDMCIQTDENEEFPSPLEGLREVSEGKPRFIIMMDFSAQVDLDEDSGLESEDRMNFDLNGSLSSGDGSNRVTPVLEEGGKDFAITFEKSLAVHRRTVSDSIQHSRKRVVLTAGGNGRRWGAGAAGCDGSGDGVGGTYYGAMRGALRTSACREKTPSSDLIDNAARRGRQSNGRWRN
ncbi:uncharacterized protein LOC129582125 isoform X2 [Paramacrobiotus metropolitanus]|uniref:uncharacterized protein LOC129582125 isoform X2 n=1 Tax=Paramacrobiotus metropolitanus TaxID=2943436 RepID=UPI0024457BB0|nr:uncharacterized protein LOC129582125 isoform X2 [Paramacrobiotus metropolitanus]